MLQRIQTLFLFASVLLLGSLLFAAIAGTSLILTIVTTAISFISIFLYRRRPLQKKVSYLNIIILLAYQALLLYSFLSAPEGTVLSVNNVIPAIAAIFTFIATIYISKDEALVRSTNRLRKK
ncbi:MAG: DUF4293 family protein [Bacteroidales bacterium]|jgi:phosphoglycerol transferase MdoB-like AlkP superfamily enzyme